MAINPTDSSIGVSTGGAAPVRVESVTDSLGNVVNEQVVIVEGLPSDTPSPYLDGTTGPLSLTNDGRLRVSTSPARSSVVWFVADQERMWGALDNEGFWDGFTTSFTHTGNPFTEW